MTEADNELGPLGYLVVEFPGNKMTGEAFPILLDLVDKGTIRILDLVFVRKDADGSVAVVEVSDFDGDGKLDLRAFDGVSSGLLDADDIKDGGAIIEAGSSAGILVYENRWAAPFAQALRRGGGQLVASGHIPLDTLVASLDSSEAAS